jgi:hypothetical protein
VAFSIHANDLAPSTAEESVSDITLAFSPTAAVPVDKLAVILAVWDNVNGDNADDTAILSVGDTKSNVWATAAECQYSAGVALDGVLVGVYFSQITTQIETTDTLTITSIANGTAKGATLVTFNRDTTETVVVAGKGYQRVAASAEYTAAVSGLTEEEHLWIGVNGMEAAQSNVNNSDSTFTLITQGAGAAFGTDAGGGAGVGARAAYKIAVGTAETYDRATLFAADRATLLVAFREAQPVDASFPARRTIVA